MKTADLYGKDFAEWTAHNARLIRQRRFAEADLEHIAEEIEDMGKRDRREVSNRLKVLIAHLLKWTAQPERRGTATWSGTIDEQSELDESSNNLPACGAMRKRICRGSIPKPCDWLTERPDSNCIAFR